MNWTRATILFFTLLAMHMGPWAKHAFAQDSAVSGNSSSVSKGKGNDGVGIAVMGGVAFSPTQLNDGSGGTRMGGASAAWGMFVDIPILPMFYIAPATTLYQVKFPNKNDLVTDLDMNLKLIVPLLFWRLGAGATVGVTNAESQYRAHYGGLVYLGFRVIPVIELFAMAKYIRIARSEQDVDNIHGLFGLMVRL